MSKHTPGPWHVIERANGQAFSIGCQVQTKGNFLATHYIAHITDRATPQAEADARLIAAAPQMLKALKKIAGIGRQLAEARAEIERKNKLIEQLKLALKTLRKYPYTYKMIGHSSLDVGKDLEQCDAALAAERRE